MRELGSELEPESESWGFNCRCDQSRMPGRCPGWRYCPVWAEDEPVDCSLMPDHEPEPDDDETLEPWYNDTGDLGETALGDSDEED